MKSALKQKTDNNKTQHKYRKLSVKALYENETKYVKQLNLVNDDEVNFNELKGNPHLTLRYQFRKAKTILRQQSEVVALAVTPGIWVNECAYTGENKAVFEFIDLSMCKQRYRRFGEYIRIT